MVSPIEGMILEGFPDEGGLTSVQAQREARGRSLSSGLINVLSSIVFEDSGKLEQRFPDLTPTNSRTIYATRVTFREV